ncbi:MAG TPA: alpha/beta hydrolase [Acidimicrobiia bacterium]|nr:alpha/beta hydrolase [Acidimicrobiia bacterium]
MTRIPAPTDTAPYDEFSMLHENAEEIGLDWPSGLAVERRECEVAPDQLVSMLVWGDARPELVFLHGGGQNAHTWDTVALALGRPALAIDLPGHGRSDRRADRNYGPWLNAEAVATVMDALAPDARGVVGMSLGGATTTRLAATRPDLTRRAVIVDVTPQVNDPGRALTPEQQGSVALIGGPPTYDSFEEVVAATVALSPKRTEAAVRRGVRHNTLRLDDGKWAWRYDLFGRRDAPPPAPQTSWADFTPLWDDVAAITVPTMVVQGGDSPFVLPEDRAEFERRLPQVRWEVVPGAGHAVQSDQPRALEALVREFVLDG